jgi:hypothetical protein
MLKKISAAEAKRVERERLTPTYYLLGFHRRTQRWKAARTGLVSMERAIQVMEAGDPRYEQFMVVSQLELNVLGMPKDRAASEYHSIEGQRRVTEASHGRSGKRKGGRNK